MKILKLIALAATLLIALPSCELVKEDLEPCPEPSVELRFIYDYNMERANAFHNQVDCLSAFFFNSGGELVSVETVTDPEMLSDESYRMHPTLLPGNYKVVAYGGMECENASFFHAKKMKLGDQVSDLHVRLDPACLTDPDRLRLHNHYYGTLDFTVDPKLDSYGTVPMMRNTNSIQIALQNEFPDQPIDHNDFIVEITDDNNDFYHDNSLRQTGEIVYKPWKKENRSTLGSSEENNNDFFNIAVAQLTTSRLVLPDNTDKPTSTRLTIKKAEDGSTLLSVPLVNYMLMFKHDNTNARLDDMDDQEYLDRENTWNFVFFLKDGLWLDTHIIINDWEVRMNKTDF